MGTPARSQSVPLARQNSMTRSGIRRYEAMVSGFRRGMSPLDHPCRGRRPWISDLHPIGTSAGPMRTIAALPDSPITNARLEEVQSILPAQISIAFF
jgi:hypothetical protein